MRWAPGRAADKYCTESMVRFNFTRTRSRLHIDRKMSLSVIYRFIALCVLAASSPFVLMAQVTDIRGFVSDSVTAQRIPFANVVIVNTSWGAATNNSGFYLIPNVPQGQYEIAVSIIGYERKVQRVLVRPGRPIDLDFQLAPTPIESEEVLITAPRRRDLTEIHTSVHLLDMKDIKLTPVLAQEDVFQALKMLPGIVSTSDVSSKFYVRGGAGDQNLVMVDGMKIYNPFHALGIFSVFDPDIVQNVEMYTGAFPAGYGGRLSSVVNISSRDGRADRPSGRASVNFLSSKVQLEGPALANTSWMVNARKSLFSQTFKRIVNQNVPVSFYDVFFKFKAQPFGAAKIDLSLLNSSDELLFSSVDEPNYHWNNSAIGIAFSNLIADRLFVQALAYSCSYRADRDAKASKVITPSSTSVKEPGLHAAATYYTDAQNLFFFGFDFSFPQLEYSLVNLAGVPMTLSSGFAEASAWVRYQARYDPWLFDIGLHGELASVVGGEQGVKAFQPRLNVSYQLFGGWRAKASAGLFSQRSITVSNEDDVMSIFDAWIKVPENLTPEKAIHLVLGVEGNVVENASVSLQSYYKDYSSLVAYNRDKVHANDPDYVTGTGSSYGLEMMVRAKVMDIDLYATYALSRTVVNNRGFEYHPRYDRRHHINLLATVRPFERADVSLRWEYGSGFPYTQSTGYYDRLLLGDALPGQFELETGEPYLILGSKNAARLPAYHRLDLSMAYRFDMLGLRGIIGGQVINLYDNKNVFYFDRKSGQRVNMLRFFPSLTLTLEY